MGGGTGAAHNGDGGDDDAGAVAMQGLVVEGEDQQEDGVMQGNDSAMAEASKEHGEREEEGGGDGEEGEEGEDGFVILFDTNPAYGLQLVPIRRLWAATATRDKSTGMNRGLILLQRV